MYVIYIPTDAPPEQREIEPTLPVLQHLVRGNLEELHLDIGGIEAWAYIDEEGKFKNRCLDNPVATELYRHDRIVGPMVVVGPPDSQGSETDAPREAFSRIMRLHDELVGRSL
jgi:hypothetical protein